MTLHLKSREYPFVLGYFFLVSLLLGLASPNCVLFQERTFCQSDLVVYLCGMDVRL